MPSEIDHRQKGPRVYIVVLNWNGWQDTVACVTSVRALTYDDYRVVVVDNGSSDGSVERVRTACPEVEILEAGENLGFSGGNNIGIRFALHQGAEYVWLLNNDTTVDPSALSAMVECAETDSLIGAVGSVIFDWSEHERVQSWGGGRITFSTGRSIHLDQRGNIDFLTGASLLLRSRALRDVGLLDDNYFMYWEDADISMRIRKAGWSLAVADDAAVFHKQSASLGKGNPIMIRYFNRSAIRFFRTHAAYPVFPIVIGSIGRLCKRLVSRDWAGAAAVCAGVWQGRKLKG
jgi:GT2 family glycosyltransferase